jgi:hypothetical protein
VELLRAIDGPAQPKQLKAAASWGRSTAITLPQFANAYNAIAFANRRGQVLNVHVTTVWATVKLTGDNEVADANGSVLELIRKWAQRRGLPPAWVWTIERSTERGLHSHLLVHVPSVFMSGPHGFAKAYLRWVKIAAGTVPVQSRGVATKTVVVRSRAERDVDAQWRWLRYVMKGLGQDTVLRGRSNKLNALPASELAGIRCRPQGEMRIKRVGTSREIGEGARRAAGFVSALDKGITDASMLYTDEYLRAYDFEQQQAEMQEMLKTLNI